MSRLKRVLLDESGQILGRIIKYGLLVALVVFLLAEVGPLIWLRVSQVQEAEDVAQTAAQEYAFYRDEDQARVSIADKLKLMGYSDEEVMQSSVVYYPQGDVAKTTVKVTLVKYANTLVTRHIAQFKRFSRIATTKEANILAK